MNKQLLVTVILAALTNASEARASDKPISYEKCYGVAKAQKNDCATKDGSNSCAGKAKKDADPNNWVYLPKGLCDKLVGGVKG